MKIFKAVVIRINDIPSENGAFSQKEIIVIPYAPDREIATEFIAIPPSVFPTDAFGSGVVTLPEINQQCIVAETDGYRRVQILSYIPFSTTTSYGEYSPVDVTSGGAAFKIGGTKPMTMYFHKGGKFELFSNEFCRFYLDGSQRSLSWTVDSEERVFAGGRVSNTFEEIDGLERSTRHVEVYTRAFEWKQNSDVRIATEKSVLNPESTILPAPDYSYMPKTIIKSGTIINEFDSNLGKALGHLYQIETRQSTYSGDKDTVTKFKLGRQSEIYKFDNDNIYPAGDLFEWTGKVARITGDSSHVTTHLIRFGELEKDVIANGAPVEYIEGEVYRNQSHINIVEPLGAPIIDILAEGKGYEFEWSKNSAEQQYLVSYGRLNSEELSENPDFLYKSAVREHFHAFDNHDTTKIATPTGLKYDFVVFGEDSVENNIFLRKFSKIADNNEKFFHKEHFTETKYYFEVAKINSPKWSAMQQLDAQKYLNFVHIGDNLTLENELKSDFYKNYTKLDGSTEKTENFSSQEYKMDVRLGEKHFIVTFLSSGTVLIEMKGEASKSPSVTLNTQGIIINPGSSTENTIYLGGASFGHKLVTQEWITQVFDKHMHPTAAQGPPSMPITMPVISAPAQNSHVTYISKVE